MFKLTGSASILLDVLRFGAACVVLLSHFCHSDISSGFRDHSAAGHLAVAVFFVLSGFVIRFVTLSREATAKQYFIDRASRIYSVAIPALLITIVLAWFSAVPIPWKSLPLQIVANLTFQAQDWGHEIYLLQNGVFWSLSFECIYYVAYGLAFYRVRYRWPLCILLFLIAGPSIALMFPVWLLGCWAFDAYQKLRESRYLPSLAFVAALAVSFVARRPILRFVQLTDYYHRTAWIHQLAGTVPWLSKASGSFVLVGILTAGFIVASLPLLDCMQTSKVLERSVRTVADSTFVLYLIHLPMLVFAVKLLGSPIKSLWGAFGVISSIILVCTAIAIPLDALKLNMRVRMENLLARSR